MAIRTLVALLAPVGGTELCVGTGVLAGQRGVLVHPSLSRRLHAGAGPEPVRVAAWSSQSPMVATSDVAAVHISEFLVIDADGGAPEPVVGLELAETLPGQGDGGFLSDADLLAHLRDPFAPVDPWAFLAATGLEATAPPPSPAPPSDFTPPDPPLPPPIVSSNVLCRFLSLWC